MQDFLHRLLHLPYRLHLTAQQRTNHQTVTYLFIHGIGATGQMWAPVIARLPSEISYIAVDLLGFGDSPKPGWQTYDALSQARCVERTLRKLHVRGDLILVGHSMGSLISVELAQLMSARVKRLLLCSPPIYEPENADTASGYRDKHLRQLYQYITARPRLIIGVFRLLERTKIAGPGLHVDNQNVQAFTTALESSIIRQSALEHISGLQQPVRILNGRLDPLTIKETLHGLNDKYNHVTYREVPAAHNINRAYTNIILEELGFIPFKESKLVPGVNKKRPPANTGQLLVRKSRPSVPAGRKKLVLN